MINQLPDSAPIAAADWPDRIYDLLKKHGIRQVALVPDAGHSRLIRRCLADNELRVVTLTTEEEGVAMLQGAWLGGQKGVLLMQSSGVGNCINMLSLSSIHRTPMPMITIVNRADHASDVEPAVEATLKFAFNTFRPTATLIGQRLLGAKTFGKD
jgi:sulfopyruvate decarboxylase TPP-binding subunit